MKNILVIGANSAFAKAFINFISKDEFNVITAGRKNCDLTIDITKEFELPENIDVAINFAAAFGRNNDEEIKEAIETNIKGAYNICHACKKAKIKKIAALSSKSAYLDDKAEYYTIYSITKRHADEIMQYYCKQNNISCAILRPSQIYGNNSDFAKNQPYFYTMLERAKNNDPIFIYGKNDPKRNYIHVEDLCNILSLVIKKDISGTYDTIYPINITFSEIAKTAIKVFNSNQTVRFLEEKPDIPDNIFEYDDSLYKLIDFYPQIDIETGIKKFKEVLK